MTNEIPDCMSGAQRAGARWRKSSYSGALGNCVEVAALPGGGTAIRNSRDPGGPALIFSHAEFGCFLDGAKDGEFDRRNG